MERDICRPFLSALLICVWYESMFSLDREECLVWYTTLL